MSFTDTPYLLFLALAALLTRGAASLAARFGTRFLPLSLLALLSLLFYASWNPLYCLPLLVTALLDYSVGRALGREPRPWARRLLLAASLFVNLSLLLVFKYFDLFARAIAQSGSAPLPFRIVFAAGISFYTFQSMSYVIDVYRRDQDPADSPLEYLAFVSFFPTLLAGPITRAETLLPQLRRSPGVLPHADAVLQGLFLIGLGFVKKCVLADTLAVNLVNRVFDLPGMYTAAEVVIAVYAYSVQIYCDFSGYSDIAIGSALVLGIRLKDNFNLPYRSKDLAEFWRRWHISLSTWLRDYLFFALPGKKPGTLFPYLNLAITFTIGGLWHGASPTFAIWGLLHGVGLAAARFRQARARKSPMAQRPSPARTVAGVLVTFHFVALTWVFFRCASLEQAVGLLRAVSYGGLGVANVPGSVALAIAAGLLFQWLPEDLFAKTRDLFLRLPAPAQAALLLLLAATVRHVSGSAVAPFIYFSF